MSINWQNYTIPCDPNENCYIWILDNTQQCQNLPFTNYKGCTVCEIHLNEILEKERIEKEENGTTN